MHDDIKQLLVLQDRDRQILRVREGLIRIPTERQQFEAQRAGAQASLDANKLRCKQIESDRKDLELQADAKKQQIEKYSVQQFQTKKNEEYRALGNEIDNCKQAINALEDRQIDLMEKAEQAALEGQARAKVAAETKKTVDGFMAELAAREENLKKEIEELEQQRQALADRIDESLLNRYQRLLEHRGANVVVGITHGVCGGCHMKLNPQILISCRAEKEVVNCHSCGRIVYYSPDMDLAEVD